MTTVAGESAPSEKRLADITVLVASHVYATGPAHALVDYLQERVVEVTFVGHLFFEAQGRNSLLRRFRRGSLCEERRLAWHRRVPEPVTWAKDFLVTVWWGLRAPAAIDLFVGADSLVAAAGLTLRRLGKANRVVFWSIDYDHDRFDSRILNSIYHRFDRFCVARCDETWNVSPRMEPARQARGVVGRQKVVPVGANPISPAASPDPRRIVFLGHLVEKQGVQLVIDALPHVLRELHDACFLVIGDGPHRQELERRAADLDVEGRVCFTGYVDDHATIERLLAESGVAVAPYEPRIAAYSLYADSGKIRNYLAAGLPVVTTSVPHLGGELVERGCGIVVEYDARRLSAALVELMADPDRHSAYRERARALGEQTLWPAVFDSALARFLRDDVAPDR